MQRTIAVEVTGEQQVKAMQKLIDKLQKSVLDVEAHIAKGRGGKPLSFKVGVEVGKGEITALVNNIKTRLDKHSFKVKFSKDQTNLVSLKKDVSTYLNSQPIKLKFDYNKTTLTSTVSDLRKRINNSDNLKLNMSPKLAFTKTMAKEYALAIKNQLDEVDLKAKVGINKTYFRKEIESIRTLLNSADIDLKLNIGRKSNKDYLERRVTREALRETGEHKFSPMAVQDISKIDLLRSKVREITLMMLKMSTINPFKAGIAGSLTFGKHLVSLVSRMNSFAGGIAKQGLTNMFQTVYGQVRQIAGAVIEETKEIGDALAVYTLNMRQLGISDSVANKDLKTLTEYGKKSVYDASELIRQATTYRAYEREDSVDLVKALAGLSAQTEDPIKSMDGIGRQLSDVLARQKVTWQDIKFMKGWFNALGANTVNKKLDEIARSKGYESAVKAIEKKAITVDELLGVLKEVGLSEGMQALVTTIATPSQALANLKENLANQFVIPEFNEDGTRGTAPLQNLYDATRDFLLELSDIVGGSNFTNFVKAVGDDVGGVIQRTVTLSKYVRDFLSPQLINSAKKFHKGFKDGINAVGGFTQKVTELVSAISSFGEGEGFSVGKNLAKVTKEVISLVTELVNASREAISGGALSAITNLIGVYTSLLKLANQSGAIRKLASVANSILGVVKKIISKGTTLSSATRLVDTIGRVIDGIIGVVKKLALGNGNVVSGALSVVNSLVRGIEEMVNALSKNLNVTSANTAIANISHAINILTTGVGKALGIILAKAVDLLATPQAQKILENIGTFVANVATIIGNMVVGASNIGVLDIVLNFLVVLTQFLADVSTLFTNQMFSTLTLAAVAYFSGLFGFLKTIWNSTNALETLLNTSFMKGVGGLISNKVRSKIPFMANYADEAVAGVGGIIGGVRGAAKVELVSGGFDANGKPLFKSMSEVSKNTGKLSKVMGKLAGSALFGKVATKFKPVAGIAKSATGVLTSGKANLIAIGAQIGTGIIDSFVQNSNAPQWAKTTSSVVSSIANVAGSTFGGASLGSLAGPWGTIAGGIYGFVSSVRGEYDKWTGKQNEILQTELENAQQQAKAETDLFLQDIKSNAKQRGDIIRDMNKQFAELLVFESSALDKGELGSAISLVQSVKNSLGTSLATTMDTLGVNIRDMPQGINDLFVRINGELVKFGDLKDQTGLSEAELYASIKLLQGTLGATQTQFLDANGNFKTQVDTFTQEQQTYNANKEKEVKEALSALGVSIEQLDGVSVGKIAKMKKDLEYVLDGSNFRTVEEQDQAIRNTLTEFDSDLGAKVTEFSGKKLKDHAQSVLDSVISATQTPQEEQSAKLDEYKTLMGKVGGTLNLTEKELQKKVEELSTKTVEEINAEIAKYTALDVDNSEGTLGEKHKKAQDLIEAIKGISDTAMQEVIEKYKGSLDRLSDDNKLNDVTATKEINEALKEAGITDAGIRDFIIKQIRDNGLTIKEAFDKAKAETPVPDISDIETSISDYVTSVASAVNDGVLTVKEAKKKLEEQGILIQNIDSNKLTTSGQELKAKVEESIKASESKQKEAKGKIDPEIQNINKLGTQGIGTSAGNLTKSTSSSIKGAEGKLNEASGKAKADYSGISTEGIDTAKNNLWSKVKSFIDDTATWLNNVFNSSAPKKPSGRRGILQPSVPLNTGGLVKPVYRDIGGLIDWRKRGTDTVPTMLTKGEYVLRKKAVEELGLNFLNRLNTRGSDAIHSFAKPSTNVYNVYNNNNAQITQNVNNKSGYLNGLREIDRFMRYV